MNTDPTRESSEPLYTQHFIPDPSRPDRAVIIGPSGPAWFPPRRANAENFNPFHDEFGRFADGDHATGPHETDAKHLGYTEEPTRHKGTGEAKQAPASTGRGNTIRDHGFGRTQSQADCVARAICTIVATEKGQSEKEAPALEKIKARVEAEVAQRIADIKQANANATDPAKKTATALPSVDWEHGLKTFGPSYMNIMARVLKGYGIDTTASLNEDPAQRLTPKQLADRLVTKGTPAMLNVGDNPKNEHAVTVQWDPHAGGDGKGRFLVDNLLADGETREFNKQQFESGTLNASHVGTGRVGIGTTSRIPINLKFPVIYVERR